MKWFKRFFKKKQVEVAETKQLNIPDVIKSVCLLIDTTCGYRTWNGKCNCEDNKCRQKQTVLLTADGVKYSGIWATDLSNNIKLKSEVVCRHTY